MPLKDKTAVVKKPIHHVSGFLGGALNLLWSLKLMLGNKSILGWSLLTIALNFFVFGGLLYLGWEYKSNFSHLTVQWIPWAGKFKIMAYLFEWLCFICWFVICIFGAVVIASIVSGPILDIISEKTEKHIIGHVSPLPFSILETCRESWIICRIAFRGLIIGLLLTVCLFWIPIVGQVVPFCIAAHYVTLNFMQPTFARHKLKYKSRIKMGQKKMGAFLGFGLPTHLIPFLLLPFLTPALVIGATRLYLLETTKDNGQVL